MNKIKKLFGGIRLTWPKLILAAVIAGIFTAAMAIIPLFHDTSFEAITVTFEVWVLFGILIIMNSESNLDAALKSFVFFLISQPLVYLIQVPFSWQGWNLFGYYRYWFVWTVLCLPMGFIGYYMKKDKWWGYLILLPMLLLTAYSFSAYFSDFLFSRPRYILISLFCACALILYPVLIFNNRKIQRFGAVAGVIAVILLTALCLLKPPVYNTVILSNGEECQFDDTYTASLAEEKYGTVEIRYEDSVEDYLLYAAFTRSGDTVLTLLSPSGETVEYDVHIARNSCELTKKTPADR